MVYRTIKYKKLKSEVEKQSKKLEKQKETISGESSDRSQKKKLERQEERLKTNNRDLSMEEVYCSKIANVDELKTRLIDEWAQFDQSIVDAVISQWRRALSACVHPAGQTSIVKMKSMFAIGFAFTALLSMFNSIFDGRVVAKLPFVPISWLQNISHRNLLGDDYTECSFIFLYILCTMSIRQNIQKMLGFAPSRAANKQGSGFFATPSQAAK